MNKIMLFLVIGSLGACGASNSNAYEQIEYVRSEPQPTMSVTRQNPPTATISVAPAPNVDDSEQVQTLLATMQQIEHNDGECSLLYGVDGVSDTRSLDCYQHIVDAIQQLDAFLRAHRVSPNIGSLREVRARLLTTQTSAEMMHHNIDTIRLQRLQQQSARGSVNCNACRQQEVDRCCVRMTGMENCSNVAGAIASCSEQASSNCGCR